MPRSERETASAGTVVADRRTNRETFAARELESGEYECARQEARCFTAPPPREVRIGDVRGRYRELRDSRAGRESGGFYASGLSSIAPLCRRVPCRRDGTNYGPRFL